MKNMTIEAFAKATLGSDPVPGGGSVSATAGALAAALSGMVAGLTVGKKKYLDVEEEMKAVIEPMTATCDQLLDDITNDSKSFDLFMQALGMPKDTEDEKAARKAAMQHGLKEAVKVPLSVAETSASILPVAKLMVEKGNTNAVTDALVASMLARTAVLGALLNVKINLESIDDAEFVAEVSGKVAELEKYAVAAEKEILELSELSKGTL